MALAGTRALVTGGAGFIGSHLVDRLLREGCNVTVYDNFATGQSEFLEQAKQSPRFTLTKADLLDTECLTAATANQDVVFHLAANADVRFGTQHPRRDIEQNTIATHNVLEAMRASGVDRIVFSSTGSVYGEPEVFPTPESCPFPIQTSLYGASKVAAESLISAYSAAFGMSSVICRFVSILGERYTHGHVFDFYRNLRQNPTTIDVLGNGKQRKSYLYVEDCVEAILTVMPTANKDVKIYNLGTDEYCTVDDSLGWICGELDVEPVRRYAGGERGWVGDSPFVFLDCQRLRELDWRPSIGIREAVLRTLRYLKANQWVLDRR
ncbi:MAG: NAD-dependent epimerase/dehydratase family protein [Chloroflexi bacterium]|nr:NAD-dependent epimerase/dehydratase family protein [Chloroflexota bacterium]MBV9894965.1 NAD-dependent epimerase/dehydratase family protein [Chloroflexota bacterium]